MLEKQPLESFAAPLAVAGQPPAVPVPPRPTAVLASPAHQLRREAARQAKRQTEPGALGAQHEKARLVSTKTHYSPTDPDAAYRRAWQRQQTRRGQRLRRVRQATVEPVFGNLIHHYGLRRMNVRGLAGAHKTMLLAAVAFNLKKLLRFRPQQHVSAVIALPRPLPAPDIHYCLRNRRASRQTRTQVK